MSGYCPTGCVCRSAAGSANPRVVPDATATAQTAPLPAWWRYRDEPDALRTIVVLHWEAIANGAADDWLARDAADIEAWLNR